MNFESLVNHISAIQDTLQAQAVHAVNLALTSRNWLMGCYIVEFEQHGEDRAAYGEQLLKKLEKQLNAKGLNERRFREFRRLYLIYPQLKEEVLGYVMSGSAIRRLATAELINMQKWMIPAQTVKEPTDKTKLTLSINEIIISEWFNQQYSNFRHSFQPTHPKGKRLKM